MVKEHQVAAVVVTNLLRTLLALVFLVSSTCYGAVLPEDRFDTMYHSYNGGGMSIDGPSILIRKKITNSVSVSANHYVDSVSSASIDVLATASPYEEQRDEQSFGIDYLNEKTIYSFGYGQSQENDYDAKSYSMGLSHSFFGDLSVINLNYSQGDDVVKQTGNENFLEEVKRTNLAFTWSQIATKNWTVDFIAEATTEEGYLNNPYRVYRYLDNDSALGYSFATEVYPSTRTSNAFALRSRYFFPINAALYAEVRHFSDTWGIEAQNFKLGYSQSLFDNLLIDFHVRHYEQTKADFYQDMFARKDQFNFMARDKEMSTFDDLTIGLKVKYLHVFGEGSLINSASVNLTWDHIQFDYQDFRNVLDTENAGNEELYSFSANVVSAYISVFY